MGWVALVGPEIEENLSLRYLAATLAGAGFDSEILPFNSQADLLRALGAILDAPAPPILVAASLAFQWRAPDVLALALALRERGYQGHITTGGHFGSFVSEDVLHDFPEVDSVCRFEAEQAIVQLASAARDSGRVLTTDILNVATRGSYPGTRPPPDLATLPWPDRRGEPALCLGHPIAALVASRGCYANCAFCCIAAWHDAQGAGRFRLRPVEDVADEMAFLSRSLGRDIFIFHDDNFFVPNERECLARIHALAGALTERGAGRIATVVKARPTDITPEVVGAMRDRLGCVRVFLGVESDATQGLRTLNRKVSQRRNHEAMQILREHGIYVCFNMLVFDPDTTFESLETNLEFISAHGHYPSNFGRVELYAGTPLLARMQAEGRAEGDYLRWDYEMATAPMQRVFELAMKCFYERNFSARALANRLQGTAFDVHVARHFHADLFDPSWLARVEVLSQELANDSVTGLREIMAHVGAGSGDDGALVTALSARLRTTEKRIDALATSLEREIQTTVGARCRHARLQTRTAQRTSTRTQGDGP